jgi:hypothetical protein
MNGTTSPPAITGTMNGEPGAKGAPHPPTDQRAQEQDALGPGEREMLAWVGEHLTLVRRTASGQRPVYWILGIAQVKPQSSGPPRLHPLGK